LRDARRAETIFEEWVELWERNKWWLLGNMPLPILFRRCLLTPVFEFIFPLASDRLTILSEFDPQIPHQTGQNDGQTEENEGQIRVHEKRRVVVVVAPPPSKLSTVLFASALGCTSFTFAEKTLQAACPRESLL